jgi:hypothetical protein
VDNQSLLNAVRSLAFTVEWKQLMGCGLQGLGPEEQQRLRIAFELHRSSVSEAGRLS